MRRIVAPQYSSRVQPDASERRRVARYPIDLPIELRSNGVAHQGRTLDVSADGVSVLLAEDPAMWASEALSFALMLQHVNADDGGRLEGSAMIVRVESRNGGLLVAFRAQCLSMLPPTLLP